jgi:signal transduction histidine kinase
MSVRDEATNASDRLIKAKLTRCFFELSACHACLMQRRACVDFANPGAISQSYVMPISQIAFVRWTLLAILVGFVTLVVIVASNIWLVSETQSYFGVVSRTHRLTAEIGTLHNLLLDAETGQRGYLLTSDEKYLEPYEEARAKIEPQLALIHSLLNHSPTQEEAIARLTEIIDSKMSELAKTITLAKTEGHPEKAFALVKTDQGFDLMTEANNILTDLLAQADGTITEAFKHQQLNIMGLRLVTSAGALVIFLVVGGSFVIVWRYTKQLAKAQTDVQELNAGLEERVQERTAELGRANDEIQRFAYIVTHDLRAPLVNIMGFTSELESSLAPIQATFGEAENQLNQMQLADARVAALEDLPEAIGFIRSSTRKMDGLINAILKLSREGRRTLKPELIDIVSLLHTAADNVQHQLIEAGGSLSIEGRIPPIVTDRLALDQIFGNLLDNAIKYRDNNRPLSIRIHVGNELGRRVYIAFEDNGRGIAAQDHDRVFDLFRRSGVQDKPGEGIGLAHVRSMTRNLGGDIMLTSELGRGTTFRVSLPKDLRRVIGDA